MKRVISPGRMQHFNPWWGCTKVSEGCANCYAERDAHRYAPDVVWGKNGVRRKFGDKHWNEPVRWNAKAEKLGIKIKVFCGSMCDIFEDNDSIADERYRLFHLILNTPNLIWLLLTKRPENIGRMTPYDWRIDSFPKNVWLGVTAENQKRLVERAPILIQYRAKVKFLSVEPMLSDINLFIEHGTGDLIIDNINWIIVGCESGAKARPMELNWARNVRDQCLDANVPFFFKQAMVDGKLIHLPELDGKVWAEFPE